MTEFLLQDHLEIQAPVELRERELTDAQRQALVDSCFSCEDEDQRGLFITFDFTHSGKVINNRIYQPWAQASGVPTWTTPVPAPVIRNHDMSQDPIGRVIDMKWVSLQDECVDMVGPVVYNEIVEAYESRDAKEIGRVMNKHNLIDNEKWPGLGKLVATARITDRDAIEKFLDGRYMQFSAGARTNRIQCSECAHTLRMHDMCEHRPGVRLEDGRVPFMVTNTYNGREATVTAFPADRATKVNIMTFDPNELGDSELSDVFDVAFTDAPLSLGLVVEDCELRGLDLSILTDEADTSDEGAGGETTPNVFDGMHPADVVAKIVQGLTDEETKALEDKLGETTVERQFLIRIHDALHSQYDWQLKYEGEDAKKNAPANVFKFHGKLHEMASADGYRDDFVNGQLDHFDSKGSESTEYVAKHAMGDQDTQDVFDDVEDIVEDAEIDWFTLDLALQALLPEDAKLSTEKREKLKAGTFCGPERSFPVPDCAHYTAAKRLVGRYKGPGDKAKILACVERKGKTLGCSGATEDGSAHCGTCEAALDAALTRVQTLVDELAIFRQEKNQLTSDNEKLRSSLAEALKDRESTAVRLEQVLDFVATEKAFEVSEDENANRLDVLTDWFATLTSNGQDAPELRQLTLIPDASTVSPVEDPTHDDEDTGKTLESADSLSSFEKKVVLNYQRHLNDYNEIEANQWLQGIKNSGLISTDFDPTRYTLNSEE